MSRESGRDFQRWSLLLAAAVASGGGWGCAGSGAAPARSPSSAEPQAIGRSALTADEAALEQRLRQHVTELAEKIGERNPEHPWELAAASDYVALQFEEFGYPVERHGYEVSGAAVQNLAVTIPGSDQADEVLVVGAHYDTAPGSRGDNANASGVAALLELARMFQGARSKRTLRLVAFAVCAPPYAGGEQMGSRFYAEELRKITDQKVIGMISLDSIGVLTRHGAVGRGAAEVQLGATEGAGPLLAVLEREIDADPLAVHLQAFDTSPASNHGAFAQAGIPAVWVTGVGDGQPLDFDAMTRLVMRLRYGLAEMLGEMPTNDGMLTPDMGLVR